MSEEKPGADNQESEDQEPSLDELLSEFDEQTPVETKPTETEKQAAPEVDDAADEVRRFIYERDLGEAVKTIRGEFDAEVFDDDLVSGYLNARAGRDPRIANAWANRRANPRAYQNVLKGIRTDFSKRYGKLAGKDTDTSESMEAVSAAVRSQSRASQVDEAPNFAEMSDGEFEQYKASMRRGAR